MSEATEHYHHPLIPAASGTFVWVSSVEWEGTDDVWPQMYRVPVVAWHIDHRSSHVLPVVAGAELTEDQTFLLESPDGPVFAGTIEAGWHTEYPNLKAAVEGTGLANAR